MAVSNQLTTNKTKKLTFSQAIETPEYKELINRTLRDEKRANRFVASVVSAVSSNPMLQACTPGSILSSALQGEALELSPSPTLGEYYLVPYKKKKQNEQGDWEEISICQFQIGTQGRIQLAMRTGQFKNLGTIEIRAGEYKGRNKENGQPTFSFIEDDEVRENLPIIGYLGYFTLINGFSHSVYFSLEKCLQWAERYSKSFDRKVYDKVQKGEQLNWKEESKAAQPWIAHTRQMCENLVLRQALKIAPKSIEMRNLIEEEDTNTINLSSVFETSQVEQKEVETVFFDEESNIEQEFGLNIDKETGEVKGKRATKKTKSDGNSFFEEE